MADSCSTEDYTTSARSQGWVRAWWHLRILPMTETPAALLAAPGYLRALQLSECFPDSASSRLAMSHFWAVLLGPPQCGPDTLWHGSQLLFTPIQNARRFWPAQGVGDFLPLQSASSEFSELWSVGLARQNLDGPRVGRQLRV